MVCRCSDSISFTNGYCVQCWRDTRSKLHTTNTSSILTWSLTYTSENGMVEPVSDIIISSTAMTQPTRTISSSVISFVRRSELRSTPLTSSMMVGSVSLGLNGIRITCSELVGTTRSETTTIYIIPGNYH